MDSAMIWNGSFSIAKEIPERPKFSNDLKNVSRNSGGHYNITIKHFEHFSGGAPGAPPSCQVGLKWK